MAFGYHPPARILRKPKNPPPLSVGHRAFVNPVPALMKELAAVPLTDEGGARIVADLVDGQEVEILAWRQRPHVHYQVRCVGSGSEGWVVAEFLRATRERLPETPAAGAVVEARGAGLAPPRKRPRAAIARARVLDVRPRVQRSAGEFAKDEKPVPCPVCGKEVHPYNLSRTPSGAIVGCYSCHGTRSGEVERQPQSGTAGSQVRATSGRPETTPTDVRLSRSTEGVSCPICGLPMRAPEVRRNSGDVIVGRCLCDDGGS